jgi:hypothetical protein
MLPYFFFPPDLWVLEPIIRFVAARSFLSAFHLPEPRSRSLKPCVHAGPREPTAVNLASFQRVCQQQNPGFHRFFAVFFGFFAILNGFAPKIRLRTREKADRQRLEADFPYKECRPPCKPQ